MGNGDQRSGIRENFLTRGCNVIFGHTNLVEDDCGCGGDIRPGSIHRTNCGAYLAARDQPAHDAVNHPKHYTQGGIECIDAMEAALTPEEFRGYLKGQIMKYNWRLGLKDAPQQEVGKLLWYGERLKKFFAKQGA